MKKTLIIILIIHLVVFGLIFFYNFITCVSCCVSYYRSAIENLNIEEYEEEIVKDFCGISNINIIYRDKNKCCSEKMMCGDSGKSFWDDKLEKCLCE